MGEQVNERDAYVRCHYCGEIRDALTDRIVVAATPTTESKGR